MNIHTKLLEIQKTVSGIGKDSENPFYKSKYFDINKLLAVVKPELNKHGLLLLQPLSNVDGKPSIKTIIVDAETGELVSDETMLTVNPDPQKMGSAITYYRRYALQSLLGLEAQDDDANSASTSINKELEKSTIEELKGKVDDAFTILKTPEVEEKNMREQYLGDSPKIGDYELLLTQLRKMYVKRSK